MDGSTATSGNTVAWVPNPPQRNEEHTNRRAAQRAIRTVLGIIGSYKGMSADAADLFRESEAALQGDGNIVNSLSNLSVSDLMRPNTGDNVGIETRVGHIPISLSALLSGEPPPIDMSLEARVQVVLASDFQGCGFPALDASLTLIGFYHLLTETVRCVDPIQAAVVSPYEYALTFMTFSVLTERQPCRTTLHAEHVSVTERNAARAEKYHFEVDAKVTHLLPARVDPG